MHFGARRVVILDARADREHHPAAIGRDLGIADGLDAIEILDRQRPSLRARALCLIGGHDRRQRDRENADEEQTSLSSHTILLLPLTWLAPGRRDCLRLR